MLRHDWLGERKGLKGIVGKIAEVPSYLLRAVGIYHQTGKFDKAPLEDMIHLIGGARFSIHIVSKELPHNVYSNPRLLNEFEQARERGSDIEIVVGPRADKESLERLTSLQPPIPIYQLETRPPIDLDLMIVDKEDVGMVAPLPPRRKGVEQNIVYHYILAPVYERMFEELREQARPLALQED